MAHSLLIHQKQDNLTIFRVEYQRYRFTTFARTQMLKTPSRREFCTASLCNCRPANRRPFPPHSAVRHIRAQGHAATVPRNDYGARGGAAPRSRGRGGATARDRRRRGRAGVQSHRDELKEFHQSPKQIMKITIPVSRENKIRYMISFFQDSRGEYCFPTSP